MLLDLGMPSGILWTGRDGYLRFIGRNEDGSVDMIDINVDDVVGNNPQSHFKFR